MNNTGVAKSNAYTWAVGKILKALNPQMMEPAQSISYLLDQNGTMIQIEHESAIELMTINHNWGFLARDLVKALM